MRYQRALAEGLLRQGPGSSEGKDGVTIVIAGEIAVTDEEVIATSKKLPNPAAIIGEAYHTQSRSEDNRFFVNLKIHGKAGAALVDTGASCSLISESFWEDIAHQQNRFVDSLESPDLLSTLTGTSITSKGTVILAVSGKLVKFNVCPELTHGILLGADALKILDALINIPKRQIILSNRAYNYLEAPDARCTISSVQSTIDIFAKEFPNVFDDGSQDLTYIDTVRMPIDVGGHPPIKQRPYRAPLAKRKEIDKQIDDMLKQDIIEVSKSPWASPVTLAPKPDNSWRFCIDYRKLNAVTKAEASALPHIGDIMDSLGGSRYFSTLDLRSGYWQVLLDDKAKALTAFISHRGHFQYKRMPFGLKNAPAVFQRLMNQVLEPYIGKICFVYLDDIVVFSRTEEEHMEHLRLIFAALEQHNLKLKTSKCHLFREEVKLLGFIINREGITSDPVKTEAISKMAPPHNVKGVRSFLGMANYYRSLIKNFASIAQPLTRLTKKYVKFEWSKEADDAFNTLKEALCSSEVMAYPDVNKPYKLYTDACDYAIGGILVQEDDNGIERPIQYVSKQLPERKTKYATIEKEAYAIVKCLDLLQHYLTGAEFVIYTDHKPCLALFQSEIKNTKLQRWAIQISDFGAPIKYRKGKNNIRADMLSRLHGGEVAQDLLDRVRAAEVGAVAGAPNNNMEDEYVADNQRQDEEEKAERAKFRLPKDFEMTAEEVNDRIPWDQDKLEYDALLEEQRTLPEYQLGVIGDEDYTLVNGLLYSTRTPARTPAYPRLVLPPTCRERAIRRAHREIGHMSVRKTISRLHEAYQWKGLVRDVVNTLKRCATCQVHKRKAERPLPGVMPLAEYPGQLVGIDLSGEYSTSAEGNKYILSIIDYATGWVESYPLKDKSAATVMKAIDRLYLPRYGPPEHALFDNGKEFKNTTLDPFLRHLGTKIHYTAPYSPQTNGRIERFHRTLKEMLGKLVNTRPQLWEQHLSAALWAQRIAVSSVTGFSPYFLQYGREPPVPYQNIICKDITQEVLSMSVS